MIPIKMKEIICINCSHLILEELRSGEWSCSNCASWIHVHDNIVSWVAAKIDTPEKKLSVIQKILKAIREGALVERISIKLEPFFHLPYQMLFYRYRKKLTEYAEELYQELLEPNNEYSLFWRQRYLKEYQKDSISKPIALDFGCGRARNIAHLKNSGFKTCGLDIIENEYWRNFPESRFDVVTKDNVNLPYQPNTFDLVITQTVLGYYNQAGLEKLFSEFFRILTPGGRVLLIESNSQSYALPTMTKYYGRRPETLETVKRIAEKKFSIDDVWYEGYYSRFFHMTNNLIWGAKQKRLGTWMISDPRAELLSPERRGTWVLKMTKNLST